MSHAGFTFNEIHNDYEHEDFRIVVSRDRSLTSRFAPILWRVTCWGHQSIRGFTRFGDALEYGALMAAVLALPDNTY